MTVVNIATGELIDMDSAAAERRAERITLRLDAIADNYRAVLPMIREAIEKRDDIALGYRSPGDYVSDRFGQSLAGLGIEVRRAVVGELTEAGLSTRAIAPVVGASQQVVHNDIKVTNRLSPVVDIEAGGTEVPPEPADIVEAELVADPMPSESYTCMTCEAHIGIAGGTGTDEDWDTQDYFRSEIERHESGECTPQTPESAAGGEASTDSGQTPQGEAASSHRGAQTSSPSAEDAVPVQDSPRPVVTGIDGKTYKRPEPKAAPRKAITDQFWTRTYDLVKKAESVHSLIGDDRFPRNAEKVAATHRNDLLRVKDLLEQVINALPETESNQ